MNVFTKSAKLSKRRFQVQKIFVEKLRDEKNVPLLESELQLYFAAFGRVIDVKVLRNGGLSRLRPAVRLRDLRRRRRGRRSAQPATLL